jgi:hypothetical protein
MVINSILSFSVGHSVQLASRQLFAQLPGVFVISQEPIAQYKRPFSVQMTATSDVVSLARLSLEVP